MYKRHKKSRHRLAMAVADMTGYPVDGIVNMPMLLCRGQCEVSIDACDGILEYTNDVVMVSREDGCVRVEGKALSLYGFRQSTLTVRGEITRIVFPENTKGGGSGV